MKNNVVSIVFIIWFICSIAAMMLISQFDNEVSWLMILFGQYFLVFGLLGVSSNKESKHFPSVILMFPLVGGVSITCGIYMLIGGQSAIDKMNEIAPYLLLLAFLVFGILLVHMSLSELLYLKKKCTYEIDAECVEISESLVKNNKGNFRRVYMPTYSVNVDGKDYRIWNNNYSSKKLIVGEYYKILINPLDPNDFIDSITKSIHKGMLFIGFIFIIVGISLISVMFFNLLD